MAKRAAGRTTGMSLESILRRIREAWDSLNRRELGYAPRPGTKAPVAPRPRAGPRSEGLDDAPATKPGFNEEALPWMDAVHRFALRLNRGDRDAAGDLVQETFLRAFRAWDTFERGSSCRSWLFTICKNTHLRRAEKASFRHEVTEAQLDERLDALAVEDVYVRAGHAGLGADIFEQGLDARVVDAIDALPEEYRDVLVLSDLGDLNYAEIARVVGVPTGTVKSRLFRARRRLQESLIDFAAEAGRTAEGSR